MKDYKKIAKKIQKDWMNGPDATLRGFAEKHKYKEAILLWDKLENSTFDEEQEYLVNCLIQTDTKLGRIL